MRLGRMWNGSGWSAARLEVQTNTGCCIVTSAGGFPPVGLPLRWSRNEACALVAGRVHLRARGVGWRAFHSTRLETRTKESNMCASRRVWKPARRKEADGRDPLSGGCIVDRP